MNNERPSPTEEVADRLRGKKVIKRVNIAQSASEVAEVINRDLNLEIENPDDFSELRDRIEEEILQFVASKDEFSLR